MTSPAELDVIPNSESEHVPPEFASALDYAHVRDFAYPEFHYLHYGVKLDSESDEDLEDEEVDDYENYYQRPGRDIPDYADAILTDKYTPDAGPPWQSTNRGNDNGGGFNNSFDYHQDVDGHPLDDDDDNGYYPSVDEIHCRAIALFDFEPENDNEYRLTAGHMVWISYRHGQGWLVAEDAITGDTGLVPEEYVKLEADLSPEDLAQLERLNLSPEPELSDTDNLNDRVIVSVPTPIEAVEVCSP